MGKIFHPGSSSNNHDPISWSELFHDYFVPMDYSQSWKAFTKEELEIEQLQDTRETDYMIEKLREVATKASSGEQQFFLALGLHKPHVPFNFPEEFLKYYPEEENDLPFKPHCPTGMPDMAWFRPEMLGFADCKPNIFYVPNLGSINVTFTESKTKELRRAYYAATSYADHELG